jgi:hypothetical protein
VGDVILLQESFNKATVALQLTGYPHAGNFTRVTDGHDAEAVRVTYDTNNWDTNTFSMDLASVTTDAYYRYWFRTSVGADPTCKGQNFWGLKWLMMHRPNDIAPRYDHGVSNGGGPTGWDNTGLEFSTSDKSTIGTAHPQPPTNFAQNVNKSVRFNTTNDGQWHKYTIHVVTNLPNGKGYEQLWIDDIKIIDTQYGQPSSIVGGVPADGIPPGGYDHSPIGVQNISLPGTMIKFFPGCDWTVDIDDLVVWHK